MADNVTTQSATPATVPASTVFATDDVASVHYPRTKIDLGGDGAASPLVRGQQTNANSIPVALASDTSLPLPSGAATEATLDARTGSLTEAAPGTDTASSGLNGRLQRIAQRLTSLIALLPTSLGAQGGLKIEGVASGTTVPVTEASGAATKTAVELIDDAVKADDAGFSVGTDKVLMSGGVAVAHGTNPDAADAADAVTSLHNRHRIPFVIGGHPNIKAATYITTAAGTDDNVLPAIGAGTKYVITRITVFLDEAATVGVAVRLGFGASTIPALGASQADAVDAIIVYHPGLVPGAGFQMGDGSGILAVGGDGEELRITNEVPTSGTLVVSVSYYTIES